MKHPFIKIMPLFLLALFLPSCKEKQEEQAEIIRPVKLIKIKSHENVMKGSFPGKVEASEKADLAFEVPGRLIKIPVIEGQKIEEGELIASLDPTEYQIAVNEAESKYKFYKGHFERSQQLYEQKFISKAKYEEAQSQVDIAQAKVQDAEKNLGDTTLEAPFRGIIGKRYVDNFQTVKAKEPIVLLHNIDKIDVVINIPESFAITAQKDQQRKIMVELETAPNKLYPATFKEISSSADPVTQTYEAKVTLPRPKDLQVLPGMTATVFVETFLPEGTDQNHFIVPSSAVSGDENTKTYVWIYDPKSSTVTKKEVTVTTMEGSSITVTKGLHPGLILVAAGVQFLREGQKVRPFQSKELQQ